MKKILVIDDDSPSRKGIVAALRRQGHEVLDAGLGAEGLALALAQKPNLVLSDVNMPGMNGFEVLKELHARAETSAIPVILMTGQLVDKEDARSGMDRGADDYLPKPFSMDQLLSTVNGRLARQDDIQRAVDAQNEAERISTAEKIRLQSTALEAAANAIAITDCEGKFLRVNRAFTHLTGYAADEAIGKNASLLKSGAHGADFYKELWDTILSGKVWRGEVINRRKDGSLFHEEKTITPVRNSEGKIQNFIAIMQDITQRRRAEEIIRETACQETGRQKGKIAKELAIILLIGAFYVGLMAWTNLFQKQADLFALHHRERLDDIFNVLCVLVIGFSVFAYQRWREIKIQINRQMEVERALRTMHAELENKVGQRTAELIETNKALQKEILQRRQSEQGLVSEQYLLQSLMDNLPDFIYFKDTFSRFTRINLAHARHLGLRSPEEAIGKRDMDFFPIPSARQKLVEEQRLLVTGEPILGLIEKADSAALNQWFSSTKVPIRGPDGSIIGLVGISHDITKSKQAKEELERKSAFLEAQMDSSIDGILVVDEKGRKTLQNQRLNDIFKVPQAIIDDHNDEKQLAWVTQTVTNPEQFLEKVRSLYSHPDETSRDEIILKDGRILDRYSAPMMGKDGQSFGRIWTFRDITERKEAELERQRMEVQLRQAQKLESIGQLAAGIAHEINTPTQYVGDNTRFLKDAFGSISNVLRSHNELLAASKQNAVTPELIENAEGVLAASDLEYVCGQIPSAIAETLDGIERVTRIVRAMKEFSHPGGKAKAAADLNKAIESTVTVARNEWKYVADLKMELAPDLPFVPCFLGEFNQCILNLIVNAAHAIGDVVKENPGSKGLITLSTHRDGDWVEVRVADSGTGIAEVHRTHIFEPFFTTKDVGKGSGQGLAIIYSCIVQKHGGAVSFETEVGKGTTFIMRLPVNPKTNGSPAEKPSVVEAANQHTST